MDNFINSLTAVVHNSPLLGYLVIFLVFFFESLAFVGLVVPGTVFLVLAGFLAAREAMDINVLFVLIFSGIFLGDGLSFYLGGKGKSFFRAGNKIFHSKYIEKGEAFFEAHGNKSVIMGRFIGPMRPLISFIAGLFKMRPTQFYSFNVIGALLWVAFYFSIGFFFGQAAKAIEIWSTRVGLFLLAAFLFLAVFYLLKRFIVKRSAAILLFTKSVSSSVKEAFLENEDVRRIIGNHPVFFGFLEERFKRGVFTGLPLTFLSVAFLYVGFLFLGVVEDVLTSDLIVSVDLRIVSLMELFRHPGLVKFFLFITMLGKWQLILVFSAVATGIFWMWKKRFYIVSLWTTIIGSMFFALIGKLAFERARPEAAIYLEKSFAFPSGHATMATAFYGFLIYFFWMNLTAWKNKINAFFANLLVIIIIGFSRIYLSVHFFSDVWAGYLLGVLWLIIGIALGEWIYFKIGGTMAEYKPEARVKALSALMILLAIASYAVMILSFKPLYIDSAGDRAEEVIGQATDIFDVKNYPRYSETLTGSPQAPISFIIKAKNENNIINIFQKAGWYLPDPITFDLSIRMAKSALLNESFATAPITPSFWNTEAHILGFQKPTKVNSIKERHHIRLWRTGFKTNDGDSIYVGTASLDVGLKWWIAHKIDPNIDTEREYIFNDLLKTGIISNWNKLQFVEPVLGKNFAGDQFFTDGEAYIISL